MVSCICSLKPIQRSSYTPHGSAHLEVGTASPFSRSISHSSWRAMNRSRKATWECSDNKLKAIVYTYNNTVNVYLVYVYIYIWIQNQKSRLESKWTKYSSRRVTIATEDVWTNLLLHTFWWPKINVQLSNSSCMRHWPSLTIILPSYQHTEGAWASLSQ